MKVSTTKIGNPIIMFATTCLFAFLHGLMMSMPITTSSYFEAAFHLNSADILNIYSFYLVAGIVMQIPIGILFAKYGLRSVMLVSASIALIGITLHMFSSSPTILLISRLISGLGCSTSYLSALYVAMNSFSNRYVVLLIGIIETVSTVGSIVAANPLYELLNKFGWNVIGVVLIAVFALLLAMIYLFIVNDANREIESISRSEILSRLKTIMTNKAVILLIAYAFLNWFIIMSFAGYWIRDYMVHIHKYATDVSLNLSNIYWTSFLVGNLVIGSLASSFKKIKIATFTLAKLGVITFLIMAIPSIFGYNLVVIFCVIAGVSSVAVILSFALIPYVTNSLCEKDIITSIVNMAIITGGVVGQYVFGYVVYHAKVRQVYFHNPLFSNSYYIALWVYVLAAIAAWVIFLKLSKLLVKHEHE